MPVPCFFCNPRHHMEFRSFATDIAFIPTSIPASASVIMETRVHTATLFTLRSKIPTKINSHTRQPILFRFCFFSRHIQSPSAWSNHDVSVELFLAVLFIHNRTLHFRIRALDFAVSSVPNVNDQVFRVVFADPFDQFSTCHLQFPSFCEIVIVFLLLNTLIYKVYTTFSHTSHIFLSLRARQDCYIYVYTHRII